MGLKQQIIEPHYEGMNRGDLKGVVSVLHDNVVSNLPGAPPMSGVEPFKQFVQVFIDAFPDAKIHADSVWEAGDTIVAEGIYSGTHTGPMASPAGSIPATGKTMNLHFLDVFKVRDGKAYEHNVYFDQAELLQQLGLMPG